MRDYKYILRNYSMTIVYVHFQVAAGLFAVHVMEKLESGDAGNLCVYLIEKLNILKKKV